MTDSTGDQSHAGNRCLSLQDRLAVSLERLLDTTDLREAQAKTTEEIFKLSQQSADHARDLVALNVRMIAVEERQDKSLVSIKSDVNEILTFNKTLESYIQKADEAEQNVKKVKGVINRFCYYSTGLFILLILGYFAKIAMADVFKLFLKALI